MDTNGRQRTGSSPSISLPSSSTFRRLPTLSRTPFRRDKGSSTTPPTVSKDDREREGDGAGGRVSAHPPRIDEVSALLTRTSIEASASDPSASHSRDHSHLLPPSRSSSLPVNEDMAVVSAVSPIPNLTPSPALDLEPITYPAHLAQTRGPEREEGSGRQRDFTLGTGTTPLLNSIEPNARRGIPETPASALPVKEDTPPESTRRRRATTNSRPKVEESRESREPRERDKEKTGRPRTKTIAIRTVPTLPANKAVTARAPASAMYFSTLPSYGHPPDQPLRAHTGTLVGDKLWLIGGVDGKNCWRKIAWFDTESLFWSTVETFGETLPPLRAHTTTLVGQYLFLFGGGDGPTYSNDIWVFDTVTHRFFRPIVNNPKEQLPPPRRAHTSILYKHYLVVFGGGNGQAALNDVWALDVSDPTSVKWEEWKTTGNAPQKKGYHTANLVGDKMIIFGGSDGHASFADVHILNLSTLAWTLVETDIKHNRLSHTSTQVGSYLFVIGGHNGQTYAQDVLLFNLVTLQWETKLPKGSPPPGRGYHVAVLHDARIYISGGYNGVSVFDDLWVLDLSAGAYLPQVTTFEVDETAASQSRRVVEEAQVQAPATLLNRI